MHAELGARSMSLRRHWRRASVLAAVAVLLHGAALSGLGWAWPEAEASPLPAASIQVRMVADAPTRSVEAPAPALVAVPVAVASPKVSLAPRPAPTVRVAFVQPRVVPDRPVQAKPDIPPAASPDVATAPAHSDVQVAELQASPAPAGEAIPVYATRIPPPAVLHYEMDRGGLHGTGELAWRPQGDHYEMTFEGRVGPFSVLSETSAGGLDATGIAPVRFTDKRLRRPMQAANFQRGAGKLTYSGSPAEFPLHSGLQDRLSWLLQLPAIMAADPALHAAGAKVVLLVTGATGDVGTWSFRCMGIEAVDVGGAKSVPAISLKREPRDPYDTTVQVWLDPARHFLPIRASLKSGPKDAGYTLTLQELELPRQ